MSISRRFPRTSWELLAKARERNDEGIRAREEFAQLYYWPVQQFLLALVRDHEQAQELAQVFFIKLSDGGSLLERAHPAKGVFHDYLKQALRHLVIDYYRSHRQEALETYPDQAGDGGWEALEQSGIPAAEAAFHYEWVKVTLAEALTRVRALCLKRNLHMHLDLFQARYLGEADRVPTWEELGARYDIDQKTARERAETVARHFRLVLRRMLRNEITMVAGGGRRRSEESEEAIDAEIRALLSPLED